MRTEHVTTRQDLPAKKTNPPPGEGLEPRTCDNLATLTRGAHRKSDSNDGRNRPRPKTKAAAAGSLFGCSVRSQRRAGKCGQLARILKRLVVGQYLELVGFEGGPAAAYSQTSTTAAVAGLAGVLGLLEALSQGLGLVLGPVGAGVLLAGLCLRGREIGA